MLKFIDGFDQYGTVASVPSGVEEVWPSNNNPVNFRVRAGRIGGESLEIVVSSGTGFITTKNLGNLATIISGVALNVQNALTTNIIMEIREDDNTTQGFNVLLNSDGKLSARRGTTTLATTAAAQVVLNTWVYIEMKVSVAEAGSYDIRVNGVSVLSNGSVDTRAGTTNNYGNRVRLYGPVGGAGSGHFYDDFYVCDATGSVNNDFLGDRRVVTIFPNADTADEDFALSAGSDSFALLDDNGLDDDTTYVESATVTDRDLFDFENVGALANINGIQHSVIARKTDVDNFELDLVTKSSSTTDVAASQTVGSTSYDSFFRIQELDPNTAAAWTGTNLDAAQFGFDVGS